MALDQTAPAGQTGQPEVVTLTRPRSPAAEAYRTLRTNLQMAPAGAPRRRLLLTSAGPGEGKSTALANLAVVIDPPSARLGALHSRHGSRSPRRSARG